jgi:putative folate metabolism gamma-glutamate ligase
MIVRTVKTKRLEPAANTILEVLDKYIDKLSEGSIIAITSKIVSICEGRVVAMDSVDKEELVKQEADYYLPSEKSNYDYHFTITRNSLTSLSGIDESNGDDNYILWPKDAQDSANRIREHLKQKFGLSKVGVIITDSTCMPFRWGTIGTALGYSGFKAVNDYIGKPDLFGRPFKVSRSGIAIGLSAAAVLAMGEGSEQTPIAIIKDVPFVEFQNSDPTREELELFYIVSKDEDLFAPFLNSVEWEKGGQNE